ncbi:hypothetical protein AB0L40_07735 [Patulibacter sp. NPDC049589]|uniref:hypothetical protein n=1 Tax=Patulibacter sp. NPDC049589 TaxID=3154731 RepID=UPI00343C930C
MSAVPLSVVHAATPAVAAQELRGSDEENGSYLVAPDWTAITMTVLFVVLVAVGVVVLVRYLRSRT